MASTVKVSAWLAGRRYRDARTAGHPELLNHFAQATDLLGSELSGLSLLTVLSVLAYPCAERLVRQAEVVRGPRSSSFPAPRRA